MMRFLAALMRALMGAATLPLRMLGIGGGVTAADVARAAMDEPARAAAPRELTLGQLLRTHLCDLVDGPDYSRPARPPLPADAAAWIGRMRKEEFTKLAFQRPHEIEARFRAETAAAAAGPAGPDADIEANGLAMLRKLRPARRDDDEVFSAFARLA